MAALADEVQAYIVQAHACFRKPALIIRDVQAEFGLRLTRSQVQYYHPERDGEGKRLARKWKDLFASARAAFLAEKVKVGIANQVYRLMLYQRAAEFYEEKGNYVLAMMACERAAKEVGGAYTNKHLLMVGGLEGARRALAVMLTEFAPQIEAGALTREQIVEMVASDHDVDPVALASDAVN